MLAKKKSKPRKKPGNKAASLPPPASSVDLGEPPLAASLSSPTTTTAGAGADPSAPLNARLDDVLRKAGVTPTAEQRVEAARTPTDPLARIPKKGQELLEQFFGGGALIFGSAFLLSGVAVSLEAFCKVLGTPLPTALDEVLVQYVEPAMTPSILTLFFFSISLGLLKQLQLGSDSAGVLYLEDEDD